MRVMINYVYIIALFTCLLEIIIAFTLQPNGRSSTDVTSLVSILIMCNIPDKSVMVKFLLKRENIKVIPDYSSFF